jgi:hypothetical protein
MAGVQKQIRDNLIALISIVIAMSALGYNTWRNERTERNRNIRVAGIEILREIGSLQQLIFYAHYAGGDQRGDPRMGWADVATIGDLAALMPADVTRDAATLRETWDADSDRLIEHDDAYARIDGAIDTLRQTTLAELRALR